MDNDNSDRDVNGRKMVQLQREKKRQNEREFVSGFEDRNSKMQ